MCAVLLLLGNAPALRAQVGEGITVDYPHVERPRLQAEGEKASKVLIAEGEKQSTLLRADAAKQARIMAAEAEAQSILKVQQAMADSMRMLNENAPNDQVIKLKALEALQKVADGKATKLIIPSEIQSLAGLAASAKMLVENDAPAAE